MLNKIQILLATVQKCTPQFHNKPDQNNKPEGQGGIPWPSLPLICVGDNVVYLNLKSQLNIIHMIISFLKFIHLFLSNVHVQSVLGTINTTSTSDGIILK